MNYTHTRKGSLTEKNILLFYFFPYMIPIPLIIHGAVT